MAKGKNKPGVTGRQLQMLARDARASWRELAIYDLLFKLLAAAVLTPLTAAAVSLLIGFTGSAAVSNQRIAWFLLTPLGGATVAVALTLSFFVSFVEESGMQIVAASRHRGTALGAIAALMHALRQSQRLVSLAALQLLLMAAAVTPLAGMAVGVYFWLLREHDIYFYVTQRPPAFLAAAGIGVVLALAGGLALAWLHVRWLFALPLCVLDGERPAAALRGSWQLTRGALARLATIVAAWLAGTFLLGALATGAMWLIKELVLLLAGEWLAVLVPAMGALVTLNFALSAVAGFAATAVHALVVARLYEQARAGALRSFGSALPTPAAAATGLPAWLTKRRIVLAGAGGFFLAMSLVSYWIVEQAAVQQAVAITAHRGSKLRAPENTLAALQLAIDEQADFIEIDVQETADGEIVLLHDKELMRVAGVRRNIWEATMAELADLDVGSYHSAEFAAERIPTLAQAIDLARGKAQLNIELKYNGHEKMLTERVVEIVRREKFADHCVITSLDAQGLAQVERLAPELQTGLIVGVAIGDVSRIDSDFLSASTRIIRQELVDELHRRGKQIHAWTVADEQTALRLMEMGVDNLITDDPPRMIAARQQWEALSGPERLVLSLRRWLDD